MEETLTGHAGHAEHGVLVPREPAGPEMSGPGVPGGIL